MEEIRISKSLSWLTKITFLERLTWGLILEESILHGPSSITIIFLTSPENMLIDFRERGKEGETEGEKSM